MLNKVGQKIPINLVYLCETMDLGIPKYTHTLVKTFNCFFL